MDRERLEELLAQAALLPPSRRRSFIEHAAADDPEAFVEALELLQALDDSGLMSAPPVTSRSALAGLASASRADKNAAGSRGLDTATHGQGKLIGPYKLLERIGEGGFGAASSTQCAP